MDIAVERTSDNLPQVRWVGALPKTSEGARLRKWTMITGAVIGAVLGFAAQGPLGLLMGAFLGGGAGGILFGKSLHNNQGQQEWAQKPVLAPSSGMASVIRAPDGELWFSWSFEKPDGTWYQDQAPLGSVGRFEATSLNEWLAGPDDLRKFGSVLGIFFHEAQGTRLVAAHAGPRADMARLYGELTRAFVTERRNIIGQHTTRTTQPERPTQVPYPPSENSQTGAPPARPQAEPPKKSGPFRDETPSKL